MATRFPSKIQVATPGELIEVNRDILRGHGTYLVKTEVDLTTGFNESGHLAMESGEYSESLGMGTEPSSNERRVYRDLPPGIYASQAGVVCQLNKLKCIQPLKCRYAGNVGDVVVGRVTEIQQTKWIIDCGAQQEACLSLTNAALPESDQRRKFREDEQAMSQYLREGDLIVAEIRDITRDGEIRLHMRNSRSGKLGQGLLTKIPLYLLRSQKLHLHQLSFGVTLILGANGWVWVGRSASTPELLGGFRIDAPSYSRVDMMNVVRVHCAIHLLVEHGVPLWEMSVTEGWKALTEHVEDLSLLHSDLSLRQEMAELVRDRLKAIGAL